MTISRERIRKYVLVGLGSFIGGVAINTFYVNNHLLSGGVSGIAMFSYFLWGWPIGMVSIILNIPLFIAAYYLLDKEYTIDALYGMLVFSISIDLTSFLSNYNFVDDVLLAAIYGGVIAGIGSGTVFRVNGSGGGLDIVSAIMKKYYNLDMGMAGFSVNLVIMIFAAGFFGVTLAMYTLLAMFITANVIDKVIEGFNRKKTVMIISDYYEQIAAGILQDMHRGVTILNGMGAYTKLDKKVVMVVVTRRQVPKIKLIAERVDPHAFMVVNDAAEVLGRGFSE